MASSGDSRLALAIYRGLLGWARRNSDVPFTLRSTDVALVLPTVQNASHSSVELQGGGSVGEITRRAFHQNKDLQGAAANEALDRGLHALRSLNTSYAALLDAMRHVRAERVDRSGIRYKIGEVFLHRKYKYRAVVYGWDRTCARDEDWTRHMNVAPDQPFYLCLPDEHDSRRLFGGVRLTKYVAEDNMEPHPVRVVHRALDNHFLGWSEALGRYVPNPTLQYEYPDEYTTGADALEPAGEDANLLLHDEPEGVKAAAAGEGGGNDALPPKQSGAGGPERRVSESTVAP